MSHGPNPAHAMLKVLKLIADYWDGPEGDRPRPAPLHPGALLGDSPATIQELVRRAVELAEAPVTRGRAKSPAQPGKRLIVTPAKDQRTPLQDWRTLPKDSTGGHK